MLYRSVFATLWLSLLAFAGHAQQLERTRLPAHKLSCTIEPLQQEYYAGEPILFRVRIQNLADSALTLVYALDGSDALLRAPYAYFVAQHVTPGPGWSDTGRCLVTDSLDSAAFVRLPPQASFDPLAREAVIPFKTSNIYPTLPRGYYDITFRYDTEEPLQPEWMGSVRPVGSPGTAEEKAQLERYWLRTRNRLRQVPAIRVESNSVRVHVRPARAQTAQLGGK